jgi:molybdopterin/thiamine biosynthesis adenylyltransferase
MVVADVLGRTGVQGVGIFDFDTVEMVNLDRLRGADRLDALLARPKTHVAQRLLEAGSTAAHPRHEIYELSICEPEGFARLLDFDIVFSCVDRPWPRHVLNTLAYADLIPVIEGGLSAFQNTDGTLRNAYWRSTLVRPGRPCLACLRQYDPALVQVERDGSLDDPSYIANLPSGSPIHRRENVAALSASVSAALLDQFVSYVARPSGLGDPGPLRFNLRDHTVERDPTVCDEGCVYQESAGCGDARLDPTSRHRAAEQARGDRASVSMGVRLGRGLDDLVWLLRKRLGSLLDD